MYFTTDEDHSTAIKTSGSVFLLVLASVLLSKLVSMFSLSKRTLEKRFLLLYKILASTVHHPKYKRIKTPKQNIL